MSIDGGQAYEPARHTFLQQGMQVGTPSVRTSFTHDIYLTLEGRVRVESGVARIKVFIKPLILWLWIGAA